ncbi:hypothetical protein FKM82_030001 [Ascaphus truei]
MKGLGPLLRNHLLSDLLRLKAVRPVAVSVWFVVGRGLYQHCPGPPSTALLSSTGSRAMCRDQEYCSHQD